MIASLFMSGAIDRRGTIRCHAEQDLVEVAPHGQARAALPPDAPVEARRDPERSVAGQRPGEDELGDLDSCSETEAEQGDTPVG